MTRLHGAASALSPFSPPAQMSAAQLACDGMLARFAEGAAQGGSLAAMSLGGLAYRGASLAFLNVGLGAGLSSGILRGLAPLFALSAEVSVFRGTNALLSGPATSRESWWTSWLHFACLKGAARGFASAPLLLQHGAQSVAMLAGEEAAWRLDLAEKPRGGWGERLAYAEVANLQMAAGARLGAWATGHFLQTLEQSWARQASRVEASPAFHNASRLPCRMGITDSDGPSSWFRRLPLDQQPWGLRLQRWQWKTAEAGAIRRLAEDYPDFGVLERVPLFTSIREQAHEPGAQAAIGDFLEYLPVSSQFEFVDAFCRLQNVSRENVKLLLHISSLHQRFAPSARLLIAQELRAAHAVVEREEGLRESFETTLLGLWAELIPELPTEHSYPERTRADHVARLVALGQRPGLPGLRATLSLGSMLLQAGWTRDLDLLRAYFGYAGQAGNALHMQDAHREYLERSLAVFSVLEGDLRGEVLEFLWPLGHPEHRLQALPLFDALVGELGERKLRARYYRRYEGLLAEEDERLVLFALDRIGASTLPALDFEDRAALMVRLTNRLADRSPEVVEAVCLLFGERLPTLGLHADHVVHALGRVVGGIRRGPLTLAHIESLSRAVPERHRPVFVRLALPTVQRLLLGA